jgi:hypothetical protein
MWNLLIFLKKTDNNSRLQKQMGATNRKTFIKNIINSGIIVILTNVGLVIGPHYIRTSVYIALIEIKN